MQMYVSTVRMENVQGFSTALAVDDMTLFLSLNLFQGGGCSGHGNESCWSARVVCNISVILYMHGIDDESGENEG